LPRKADIDSFDLLMFGIPTWYYGEAQADWDDFFPNSKRSTSTTSWWPSSDAAIRKTMPSTSSTPWAPCVTSSAKGAIIIGHWPTASYEFEASKALVDDKHFVGLGIDEDRQPELTAERVKGWCKQLHEEMCLGELE
jgi:flavodoxin I